MVYAVPCQVYEGSGNRGGRKPSLSHVKLIENRRIKIWDISRRDSLTMVDQNQK